MAKKRAKRRAAVARRPLPAAKAVQPPQSGPAVAIRTAPVAERRAATDQGRTLEYIRSDLKRTAVAAGLVFLALAVIYLLIGV